ncbi:MAG: thioredoxin domain-containing protein, partial [Gammaproteobacteria bacterium]|nr:thioredoxin domain-containing protein [Gammaproteobacteria bacterium]
MRLLLPFLLLPFCLFQIAFAAGEVKQRTVSDFLLQAAAKAEKEGRKANSLINESSPYLLQHAYNPVDWYAWGDVAFEKARKENKPIFLSIGYSTCHWCHVMAHESFENKAIAEILNRYFVCIKVDREQRPDIDSVYMSATQLINGSGGWPMSVFLDNKLRPFHAATYYP